MSTLRSDNIVGRDQQSSPNFPKGAVIAGVATATTFKGGVEGNVTGNVTGNITGNVTGNLSGDIIGTRTLGTGVTVTQAGVVSGSNFKTGTTNVHNVGIEAAGINVLGADTPIGAGVTIYNAGGADFTGVVTATSYRGDGSQLTGIDATTLKDNTGATKIQATTTGAVVTGVLTATTFKGDGSQLTNLPTDADINTLNSNIAMLGFKVAVNGSLAKYSLVDQVIDEYTDTTGIDASASSTFGRSGTSGAWYYSGIVAGNYFGTGGDGDVTISSNTSLTVSNTNGSYDGDMVFKQYNNLTINSNQTLTTNVPCRGLFIYVKENCVLNGLIDMTSRGAYANPGSTSSPSWGNAGSDGNTLGAQGLQLGMARSGGTETYTNDGSGFNGCGTAVRNAVANQNDILANGKIYRLGREGAAGGSGTLNNNNVNGNNGSNGTAANPGGGGGSGATSGSSASNAGSGAHGSCWSGGSGGAGTHGSTGGGAHATAWGGPAGGGNFGGNAGGAGNPGGGGNGAHGGTGETGTGGTVWLIVGGTLSGNGIIRSKGKNGGPFVSHSCGGGGGSGGGAAVVLAQSDTSSINFEMAGGVSYGTKTGGNGGSGYSIKEEVDGPPTTGNMVLQSVDTTASSAPSKADMVMLIEDGAGTATLNTDIKGYVSRDSGTTWTQGTLVNEGSWVTNKKILSFHNLDISSQPSGTAMCYKITTHNQTVSKETRVHATSLGWS